MKKIFNIILLILIGIGLFSSCKISDEEKNLAKVEKTYNFNNNAQKPKYEIRTFEASKDSYNSVYVSDAKSYKYIPDEVYIPKQKISEKSQQRPKEIVAPNNQAQPNSDKNLEQLSKQMQEMQSNNASLKNELEEIKNSKPQVIEKVIVKEVSKAPTQEINIPNYDKNFADLMKKMNEMQSANLVLKNELEEIKNSKPQVIEKVIVKEANNTPLQKTNIPNYDKNFADLMKKIDEIQNENKSLKKELEMVKNVTPAKENNHKEQNPINKSIESKNKGEYNSSNLNYNPNDLYNISSDEMATSNIKIGSDEKQKLADNNSDYNSNDLYALSQDEMATSKVKINYENEPIITPEPIIAENKPSAKNTLPWKNTINTTPLPWESTANNKTPLPWEVQTNTSRKPVDIDYNFNKNINNRLISIFRGKLMLDNEYLQDHNAEKKYKCDFNFKDEQNKSLKTIDIENGYTIIESENLGRVFLESVTCILPYLPKLKPITYYFNNLYFNPVPSYINYAGEIELFWVSNLDFPNQTSQCCAVNKQANFGGKIVPTFNNEVDNLLLLLADAGVSIEVVNSFFNTTRKIR